MSALRVLIVDDHPMMRRGLRETLSGNSDFAICGEAGNVAEALEHVRKERPDLALVDVSLPDGSGLELARDMLALDSNLRILFVSIHDDAVFAERALRAGALGYVNKARPADEILASLRKVARGELALSQPIADRLVRRGVSPTQERARGIESLTDRELEIFELIGRGLGTREIADRLSLSVKTVETHREHIKTKLDLGNAAELSRHAALWGTAQS